MRFSKISSAVISVSYSLLVFYSLWSRGCIRLLHAPHLNQTAALAGVGGSTLIFDIKLLAIN